MTTDKCNEKAIGYPIDRLQANDGTEFGMYFFKHASLALEIAGKWIYTDPVTGFADYDNLPKADLILISHHHYDHFEVEAVQKLLKEQTQILCDHTTAGLLAEAEIPCTALRPAEEADPFDFLHIRTVAAYNYSEGRTGFHPRKREDVGYLLQFGGTTLYIAGDGEDTPEMKALEGVDIALLPVNQPYTMTVDQAVGVVKALRPRIFYPYHYGQVEEVTDLERLASELAGVTEVRIRGME